jgi:general secretion pathway protein L
MKMGSALRNGWRWMTAAAQACSRLRQTICHRPDPQLELVLAKEGGYLSKPGGTTPPPVQGKTVDGGELRAALLELRRHSPSLGRALGLRLSPELVLMRDATLPTAALSKVEHILKLEIERLTPFAAADVCQGWSIVERASSTDEASLHHVIIKRAILEPWLDFCRSQDIDLSPWLKFTHLSDAVYVPEIDQFNRDRARGHRRLRDLAAAAAAAAIVLLIGAAYWRQSIALAELSRAVELADDHAASVRAALSRLEISSRHHAALRRHREERLHVSELLGTLTELVPDSAWLSELRIGRDGIALSGYASSAVELLGRIEASPLLERAVFTTSVTMAPDGSMEQFSIQAALEHGVLQPGSPPTGPHP